MYDIDALRGMTPATIRAAFNHSAEICEEHGDMGSTNVSGILTRIIQAVGRFNQNWGSDALYGMDKIRGIAGDAFRLGDVDFDEIISFGIREDGVDHNAYVMQNLLESRRMPAGYVFPKQRYRQVLAVRMRAWADREYHCIRTDFSLRDVTNAFHTIDPADFEGDDVFKLAKLPNENKTSPEPSDARNKTDQEEIAKRRADGYKRFTVNKVPGEILESEGCAKGVTCIEIIGQYDPIVPPSKNPSDDSVCRVYLSGQNFVITWTNPWYKHYQDALDLIEAAKNILLNAKLERAREAARNAGGGTHE